MLNEWSRCLAIVLSIGLVSVIMSYLSNYVKDIFIYSITKIENELLPGFIDNPITFQSALHEFEKDSSYLLKLKLQSKQEYMHAVKLLNNFFHKTACIKYIQIEVEYYSNQIVKWLTSVQKSQVEKWFQATLSEPEMHLNLLQITAALEFALGNVSWGF